MRVLHVISDRNIGGAGVLLTSLLRHMDRGRVESIVALPVGSRLKPRIEREGIETRELMHDCDRVSLVSVKELCSLIKEENIDLVHANAAICARVAGRICHRAVVHTRHCCFPTTGLWRHRIVSRLGGRINTMLSDRVIATADAAAENLRCLGVSNASIELIENGSEAVRPVTDTELALFRKRFAIEAEDFCIGICARLEEYKGHDTFLRAAGEVVSRMPQISFRFLIIGDGTERSRLEHMVDALNLRDVVRFLGFVEDMAPVYRALRINVNCSRGTETSCLALSEGMSASVPFIASDYGGNRAMHGGSEGGILFPVDDFHALADAICRIVSDPTLEVRMRHAARQRYEEKYTADKMSEHLLAVYESLLKCGEPVSRP